MPGRYRFGGCMGMFKFPIEGGQDARKPVRLKYYG